MKKSEQLSRKTRKLIAKNLIVLATLAVVAFVGVFSWFSSGDNKSTANGISVAAQVPDGLEVAVMEPGQVPGDDDWKDSSFTISDDEYTFLAPLSLADITGDGKTFIRPPIYQIGTVATVQYQKNGTETTSEFNTKWSTTNLATVANTDYFSIDLYMRSRTQGQKVVLDENTYLGPLSEENNFGNKTAGYSADSVIGAARMAVYNAAVSKRELLWIPAPHLYYDGIDLFNKTYKTTNDLLNPSNTYGLYYTQSGTQTNLHTDGTYNHGYYTSSKTRQKIYYNTTPGVGVTANNQADFKLHTDVDLVTLNTASIDSNGDTYYVDHVRINIWVEGEDPESRSAQITGKFKSILALKFG